MSPRSTSGCSPMTAGRSLVAKGKRQRAGSGIRGGVWSSLSTPVRGIGDNESVDDRYAENRPIRRTAA